MSFTRHENSSSTKNAVTKGQKENMDTNLNKFQPMSTFLFKLVPRPHIPITHNKKRAYIKLVINTVIFSVNY